MSNSIDISLLTEKVHIERISNASKNEIDSELDSDSDKEANHIHSLLHDKIKQDHYLSPKMAQGCNPDKVISNSKEDILLLGKEKHNNRDKEYTSNVPQQLSSKPSDQQNPKNSKPTNARNNTAQEDLKPSFDCPLASGGITEANNKDSKYSEESQEAKSDAIKKLLREEAHNSRYSCSKVKYPNEDLRMKSKIEELLPSEYEYIVQKYLDFPSRDIP